MISGQPPSTDVTITDWLRLIRSEYLEVPGLQLTLAQARRLWGLDDSTSAALFDELVSTRFLRETRRGTYILSEAL